MTQQDFTVQDGQYGWKNVETGTICQNVVKESPQALYEDAGLSVPEDPIQPRNGFQAVLVKVVGTTTVKWENKGRNKKFQQMIVEEA